jgi:hypothetical protein
VTHIGQGNKLPILLLISGKKKSRRRYAETYPN